MLLSCGSEESRLADSYYQNKNYNKAIEYYTESLKLKPNDTQSLYRRGRSFEEIKQFQNAIKDYNKVLELDKENVNAILSVISLRFTRCSINGNKCSIVEAPGSVRLNGADLALSSCG